MTRRARRTAGALLVAFALLFVGRWLVAFLAERWWARTISPAAATFVAQWQIIGMSLDSVAVIAASLWFVMQALLVGRAIASVQVTQRVGDLQFRQVVPVRWLLMSAIGAGVLLGLVAGAGAHGWRSPMALAWQGVHYGIADPVLGHDLGIYVASLPAWDLLFQFGILLAGLGLAFALAMYVAIGAIRRDGRTITVHPDARRHLGFLAAVTALLIGAGYCLEPYHLAFSELSAVRAGSDALRPTAALVAAGIAFATAVLSAGWAWRGRRSLLIAAWAVLGVAALAEHFVVPVFVAGNPAPTSQIAAARHFDALAWGLRIAPASRAADSIPPVTVIWDERMLSRLASVDGGLLEGAAQMPTVTATGTVAAWMAATTAPQRPDRLDILAVVDGAVAAAGADSLAGAAASPAAPAPWRIVALPRILPSAPPWRAGSAGVDASSLWRRLILAWARQQFGMLARSAGPAIDWHLDPSERAAAILPMFTWMPPRIALVDQRPVWLVQGFLLHDRFPLATVVRWRSRSVAGASPAVDAIVDVVTGATRFFLDPAADAAGRAWATMIGPLVGDPRAIPGMARSALDYPTEWLEMQALVLATPRWTGGSDALAPGPVVPVWRGAEPGRQIALEDEAHAATREVITAGRDDGVPQLDVERFGADATLIPGQLELHRRFSDSPTAVHLIDSVAATGDSALWRGIRWLPTTTGVVAWQPLFALPRNAPPVLLWLGVARGDRVGGGRTPAAAWRSTTASAADTGSAGPSDAATVEQARRWLDRADSAFRRGDLTAFGRAFEQLRAILRAHR